MSKAKPSDVLELPAFIAPKELADRWQCGRSSVDRIARRARFTRVCLGDGKNGMVRYLRRRWKPMKQAGRCG
jgi:hypothetical protein